MKILAIIEVVPGADMQKLRAEISHELKGSWSLFASGFLREAYATEAPTRVVFVIESESRAQAEAQLRTLPLVGAGLMKVELVELRPFVNWSLLFAP